MSFSLGKAIGGGAIGGAIGGPGGALAGAFTGGAGLGQPGAPNLPSAPNLQTPTLPGVPDFTSQEQQLLQQRQGYLGSAGDVLGQFNQNPYLQNQNAIGQQTSQNYLNALQGNIPANAQLAQQKQRDWQNLIEQMGQNGVKIQGKDPGGAYSNSTAGNQAISDFNNRYSQQEQNYNLGQQQFGLSAYSQGLGLANTTMGNQMNAYGQLGQTAAGIQDPYAQQRMAQFNQQTQQALSNTDIANQNLMNQYSAQLGQTNANYQNQMAGYQANMGMVNAALGLGGQLGTAFIMRGAGGGAPAAGGQATAQTFTGGNNTMGMMNPQMSNNPLSMYRFS